MMELCALIGPRYERVDTELLIFGAFLHDLGKVHEISSSGELSYTDRGQLVGHIVIGIQMLGEMIQRVKESGNEFPDELRVHLEHLIVSHHGQLEFGSPPTSVHARSGGAASHRQPRRQTRLLHQLDQRRPGQRRKLDQLPPVHRTQTLEEDVTTPKPAIVLLSGGLDSATCVAIAKDQGFAVHSISFRYGQRHEYELERASALASEFPSRFTPNR